MRSSCRRFVGRCVLSEPSNIPQLRSYRFQSFKKIVLGLVVVFLGTLSRGGSSSKDYRLKHYLSAHRKPPSAPSGSPQAPSGSESPTAPASQISFAACRWTDAVMLLVELFWLFSGLAGATARPLRRPPKLQIFTKSSYPLAPPARAQQESWCNSKG
jgi:hypothetical protein